MPRGSDQAHGSGASVGPIATSLGDGPLDAAFAAAGSVEELLQLLQPRRPRSRGATPPDPGSALPQRALLRATERLAALLDSDSGPGSTRVMPTAAGPTGPARTLRAQAVAALCGAVLRSAEAGMLGAGAYGRLAEVLGRPPLGPLVADRGSPATSTSSGSGSVPGGVSGRGSGSGRGGPSSRGGSGSGSGAAEAGVERRLGPARAARAGEAVSGVGFWRQLAAAAAPTMASMRPHELAALLEGALGCGADLPGPAAAAAERRLLESGGMAGKDGLGGEGPALGFVAPRDAVRLLASLPALGPRAPSRALAQALVRAAGAAFAGWRWGVPGRPGAGPRPSGEQRQEGSRGVGLEVEVEVQWGGERRVVKALGEAELRRLLKSLASLDGAYPGEPWLADWTAAYGTHLGLGLGLAGPGASVALPQARTGHSGPEAAVEPAERAPHGVDAAAAAEFLPQETFEAALLAAAQPGLAAWGAALRRRRPHAAAAWGWARSRGAAQGPPGTPAAGAEAAALPSSLTASDARPLPPLALTRLAWAVGDLAAACPLPPPPPLPPPMQAAAPAGLPTAAEGAAGAPRPGTAALSEEQCGMLSPRAEARRRLWDDRQHALGAAVAALLAWAEAGSAGGAIAAACAAVEAEAEAEVVAREGTVAGGETAGLEWGPVAAEGARRGVDAARVIAEAVDATLVLPGEEGKGGSTEGGEGGLGAAECLRRRFYERVELSSQLSAPSCCGSGGVARRVAVAAAFYACSVEQEKSKAARFLLAPANAASVLRAAADELLTAALGKAPLPRPTSDGDASGDGSGGWLDWGLLESWEAWEDELMSLPAGGLQPNTGAGAGEGDGGALSRTAAFLAPHSLAAPLLRRGTLVDASGLAALDPALQHWGVHPTLAQMSITGGKTLGVPLDGSQLLLFLRADVFSAAGLLPPASWQELLQMAERLNGTSTPAVAGAAGRSDQGPLFGFCLPPPRLLGSLALAVLAPMVQTNGTREGMYLDPSSLRPAAATLAMSYALSYLRRLATLSPSSASSSTSAPPYSEAFAQGRCAMTVGSAAQFRRNSHTDLPSAVRGQVLASLLPGSELVLSRGVTPAGDSVVPCTPGLCPHAVATEASAKGGPGNATAGTSGLRRSLRRGLQQGAQALVNRAPLLSPDGLVGAIAAGGGVTAQLLSWSLLSSVGGPSTSWELLLPPGSEVGPWRQEHFQDAQRWAAAGYDAADTASFLRAAQGSLDHPNVVWPLRVEGAVKHNRAVSTAAEAVIALASAPSPPSRGGAGAGEVTPGDPRVAAAVGALAEAVTALYGAGQPDPALRAAYLDSLPGHRTGSLSPNELDAPGAQASAHSSATRTGLIVGLVTACVVVLAGALALGYCVRRRGRAAGASYWALVEAPPPGPATCIAVTDIEGSTSLWEALPEAVLDRALRTHHCVVRTTSSRYRGYESATEGDSFILAFATPAAAASFAVALQQELLEAEWPAELLAAPSCRPVFVTRREEVERAESVSLTPLPAAKPQKQALLPGSGGVMSPHRGFGSPNAAGQHHSVWHGYRAAVMALTGNRAAPKPEPAKKHSQQQQQQQQQQQAPSPAGGRGFPGRHPLKRSLSVPLQVAGPEHGNSTAVPEDGSKAKRVALLTFAPAMLASRLRLGRSSTDKRLRSDAQPAASSQVSRPSAGGSMPGGPDKDRASSFGGQFLAATRRAVSWRPGGTSQLSVGVEGAVEEPGNARAGGRPSAGVRWRPPAALGVMEEDSADANVHEDDSEDEETDDAPAASELLVQLMLVARQKRNLHASELTPVAENDGSRAGSRRSTEAGGVNSLSQQPARLTRPQTEVVALVFTGLRVRVGLHCGVQAHEIVYNPASARQTFGGEALRIAKGVTDCASGGQVVLSGEVLAQVQLAGDLSDLPGVMMDLGDHQLFESVPHLPALPPAAMMGSEVPPLPATSPAPAAPSTQLLQLVSAPLLGRLALMPPFRPAIHQYTPGFMDAPVGESVAVVVFRVAHASALLAWDAAVAAESLALLELFLRASLGRLLPSASASHGPCYLAAASPGCPLGTFVAVFANPAAAGKWALEASSQLEGLPWPQGLLESRFGAPLEGLSRAEAEALDAATAPRHGLRQGLIGRAQSSQAGFVVVETEAFRRETTELRVNPNALAAAAVLAAEDAEVVTLRGLRVRAGLAVGPVRVELCPMTGRVVYSGKPVTAAMTAAAAARLGTLYATQGAATVVEAREEASEPLEAAPGGDVGADGATGVAGTLQAQAGADWEAGPSLAVLPPRLVSTPTTSHFADSGSTGGAPLLVRRILPFHFRARGMRGPLVPGALRFVDAARFLLAPANAASVLRAAADELLTAALGEGALPRPTSDGDASGDGSGGWLDWGLLESWEAWEDELMSLPAAGGLQLSSGAGAGGGEGRALSRTAAFLAPRSLTAPLLRRGALVDASGLETLDPALQHWGVHPTLAQLTIIGGQTLGVPLDGSQLLLFLRADVFSAAGLPPPASWQELLQVAERLNGTSMPALGAGAAGAPDQGPLFGFCLPPPRLLGSLALAVLAPMVQTNGTGEGMHLDASSLRPAAATLAMSYALSYLRRLATLSPYSAGSATSALLPYSEAFALGSCALTVGSAAQFRRNSHTDHPAGPSAVRGQVLASLLQQAAAGKRAEASAKGSPGDATAGTPGLRRSLRRGLQQGAQALVNRAPLLSPDGLVGAIAAGGEVTAQLLSWSLLSSVGGPSTSWELLLPPGSEVGPWRQEHFQDAQRWAAAGYDAADTASFLRAAQGSLDHPNVVWPLRVEGAVKHNRAVSTAAEAVIALASAPSPPSRGGAGAGEVTAGDPRVAAAVGALAEAVTALYGAGQPDPALRAAYLDSLPGYRTGSVVGGTTVSSKTSAGSSRSRGHVGLIVGLVVGCTVAVVAAALALGYCVRRRGRAAGASYWALVEAPPPGPATCIAVTDIEGSTSLWEALPEAVLDRALRTHHRVVRTTSSRYRGYESATEGDSFILAFATPAAAASFAMALQQALLEAEWPAELLAAPSCRPVFVTRREEVERAESVSLTPLPAAKPHKQALLPGSGGVMSPHRGFGSPNAAGQHHSVWHGYRAAVMALTGNRAAVATPTSGSDKAHQLRSDQPFIRNAAAASHGQLPVVPRDASSVVKEEHDRRSFEGAALDSGASAEDDSEDVEEGEDAPAASELLVQLMLVARQKRNLHASELTPVAENDGSRPTPGSLLAYIHRLFSTSSSAKVVSASQTEVVALVFAGLRVRVGLHCGVQAHEIVYNPASARQTFGGEALRIAKGVTDCASGGQVVLSGEVLAQVQLAGDLSDLPGVMMDLGDHQLFESAPHLPALPPAAAPPLPAAAPAPAVPSTQLLQLVSAPLLGRLALMPPFRPAIHQYTPGFMDAPVGESVAVVVFRVAHASALLAWDAAVAAESLALLELFLRASLGRLLPLASASHGPCYLAAAPPGCPLGTFVAVFANPAAAGKWALEASSQLEGLPWPQGLLESRFGAPLEGLSRAEAEARDAAVAPRHGPRQGLIGRALSKAATSQQVLNQATFGSLRLPHSNGASHHQRSLTQSAVLPVDDPLALGADVSDLFINADGDIRSPQHTSSVLGCEEATLMPAGATLSRLLESTQSLGDEDGPSPLGQSPRRADLLPLPPSAMENIDDMAVREVKLPPPTPLRLRPYSGRSRAAPGGCSEPPPPCENGGMMDGRHVGPGLRQPPPRRSHVSTLSTTTMHAATSVTGMLSGCGAGSPNAASTTPYSSGGRGPAPQLPPSLSYKRGLGTRIMLSLHGSFSVSRPSRNDSGHGMAPAAAGAGTHVGLGEGTWVSPTPSSGGAVSISSRNLTSSALPRAFASGVGSSLREALASRAPSALRRKPSLDASRPPLRPSESPAALAAAAVLAAEDAEVVTLRGLRVRAGLAVGAVRVDLCPMTGRVVYSGKPVTAAMTAAAAARLGTLYATQGAATAVAAREVAAPTGGLGEASKAAGMSPGTGGDADAGEPEKAADGVSRLLSSPASCRIAQAGSAAGHAMLLKRREAFVRLRLDPEGKETGNKLIP
ncbi:hypothetical protein HYH03_004444 [Edaphochlamys debaryana]|uniref:Guanylate cyclase domain-containing protein n=1 Tax=Edaphochlamys debaryana TaxID=47281 RepID=A0A835YA16_9CHLO|nr:hypothetical protein HYH03_004444 [Edaphochlamys debaryana]|eukprot:KAG2497707.1 hypothetical protein HYH03_004444 [Edaphochlamys debaryana]